MNSVDTFHKRLRDEIAAVEKDIQSRNQQVESLTKRLEGLKRANELFDSDQAAIGELLQTSIANGSGTRSGDSNPASRHDAKSGGQPKGDGNAKAARARYSDRPRQDEDRRRQSGRSLCEPRRRAHARCMIAAVLGAIRAEPSAN